MVELLRAATFLLFLALGFTARMVKAQPWRRYALNTLIVYLLLLHALLAFAGKDAWPFTTYPLIQKTSHGESEYRQIVFYGVDQRGKEWRVDPEAWSPVSPPVLMQWMAAVFPTLAGKERREAMDFLLRKAEQRRQAVLSRVRPPKQRLLGSLAAPDWWLYRHPGEMSPTPFVALRIYVEHFSPRARVAGTASRRELMAEGRP